MLPKSLLAFGLFLAGLLSVSAQVISANTLLNDLVREVVGADLACVSLVPAGVDPHSYQPAPGAVRQLTKASVVVVNGLGLDPWVDRLIENSGYQGPVIVASRGIQPLALAHDHDHDHDHEGEVDPHAWHDLRRVMLYVRNIEAGLVARHPEFRAGFSQRAADLLARIESLDTEARQRLGAIPVERRRLVTSHDSLAYLGEAYGLTVIPIAGLRPDREPSARSLGALVRRIQKEKVSAIFIESTSNPKIPQLLAQEAGVRVVTELYTDSLGPVGSPGETFLGMFRHNLDTLVTSLQP